MDEQLVHLSDRKKPRVHYRALAKRFTRPSLTRELELVSDKEKPLHPALGADMVWYTSRYVGPGEDYREARVVPMADIGLSPGLLVYRVLKDLFGAPDIITVAFPKHALDREAATEEPVKGAYPWEWSFMLKGTTDVFIEVRREPGTQQPHLAIWIPKLQEVSAPKLEGMQSDVKVFVDELLTTLKQSRHLVDAKQIKAASTSLGPLNLYSDLLAAGDELMATAARLGKRYNRRPDKGDRAAAVGTTLGTFYMAAAIDYLLALEAFVNLLIELLRKADFQDEVFDRATTKVDFELRVLTLSLYCAGFDSVPFPPNSQSFKNVRRLRAFRNNLLHGNVSRDDHVMYLVPEDHFIHHWWPATDSADKLSSSDNLPLARVLFRKGHAQAVRKLVEEIVDAIQASLARGHQAWVKGWRRGMLVPAVLKKGRWEPNLKPSTAYTPKKRKK